MFTIKTALITTLLLFVVISGYSQTTDSLAQQEALLPLPATINHVTMDTASPAGAQQGLNAATYFNLLGHNLKQAFTKPFHMTGKEWGYVSIAALFTAGLSFDDEPVQQYALHLRNNNPTLCQTSRIVTEFGGSYEIYALSAFGAYSFLLKKEKMKTATLLATQAYLTGAAVESVVKFLSVRMRPSFYDPHTEAEPTFNGPFDTQKDFIGARTHSSFPSGHTTAAFAVATVFATMYKDRPWIPAMAYSAASLVGLSRITENRHWLTDVAVGAALGYLTGKQAVNNYHRFTSGKSSQKLTKLRFNLQYNYGRFLPGLTYKL